MTQDAVNSQYSNSATRQLINAGGGLGRWLKNCVATFADDLAGESLDDSPNSAVIVAKEDRTEVYIRDRQNSQKLMAELPGNHAEITRGLRGLIRRKAKQKVLLRIDGNRAVIKQINLPASALDVLPAVIRNKVESLAPWPLQQVMWGYRLAAPLQSGQISVDVGIVARKATEALLGAVQGAGIKVAQLDIATSPHDAKGIVIDFQGRDRTAAARRKIRWTMAVAALLALVTASYGLYLGFFAQRELSSVDRRVTLVKEFLLNGRSSGEISAQLSEANKLYRRKSDTLPFVVILSTLTKAVPDGTWLNGIDYAGERLTITGRGTEISNVIESLEKSESFADVNFASATQRDPDINADIFSISARVQTRGTAQ